MDCSFVYNSVGQGWWSLLRRLVYNLELIEEASGLKITVIQVKEKFGGLRFYYYNAPADDFNYNYNWTNVIEDLIDYAEERSFKICEICGKSGEPRKLSWIKTLCDEHYEEALNA